MMQDKDLLYRLMLFDVTNDSLLDILKDRQYIDFGTAVMSKDFKSKTDLVAKLVDLEKRGFTKGRLYKYKITFKGQLWRLYGKRWINLWSFIIGVVSLLLSIIFWRLTIVEQPESKSVLMQPTPSIPQATYDSVLNYQISQKKTIDSLTTVLDALKTKLKDTAALRHISVDKTQKPK